MDEIDRGYTIYHFPISRLMRPLGVRNENMTLWDKLKNVINESQYHIYRAIILPQFHNRHWNSIDTYLGYLRKAGYLQTVYPGKYRKEGEIPSDLMIDDAKNGMQIIENLSFGEDGVGWSLHADTANTDIPMKPKDFITEREMRID